LKKESSGWQCGCNSIERACGCELTERVPRVADDAYYTELGFNRATTQTVPTAMPPT